MKQRDSFTKLIKHQDKIDNAFPAPKPQAK